MEKLKRKPANSPCALFNDVYDRYWSAIFYFVSKYVPHTAEAEDITVESFVKLWQRLDQFEHERSIISFLYATARNASIDWLRAEKRQICHREELLYLLQQEEHNNPQVSVKAEVLRQLQCEIEKLPSKRKKVLLLSYMEGKTNEEIAVLLDINKQSVRNHKSRAVQFLRLAIAGKTSYLWCSISFARMLMAFI